MKHVPIHFEIPVTEMANVNMRLTAVHHGLITVRGQADLRDVEDIDIDYDSVEWNGANILNLLEHCPAFSEAFEFIREAAHQHARDIKRSYVSKQDYINI